MGDRMSITGARTSLALLLAINLFNYIDRQVLAAVEPQIRRELLFDMPAETARVWMGILPFAFLVCYMLLSPVFGILADRYSRWALVGLGVVIWSLASGASGIPWIALGVGSTLGFSFLLMTRCLVGIGEAAYGPVAPAMISDLFPVEKRGMVLAFFYAAIPVGGALGYALGEGVARLASWHWAFASVVPPGILLGVLCYLMRDPPRGLSDGVAPSQTKLSLATILKLLRIPSYTLNTIGMTFMTFAIGGIAYWMADFLETREVPPLGSIGPITIGPVLFFGFLAAVAGLLSTIAGGIAGDLLRRRFSGSYFLVSGIALLIGCPMVIAMLYTPFPLAWVFVFLAVFFLFFNTGPTNTILANVTRPGIRASGYALNILIIHLFGDAISPGIISLASLGQPNLDRGFIVAAALMAMGGIAWLVGARYLAEDTRLAPTRV